MKNFFLFLVLLLAPTIAHADVFDAPCSRYRVPKPLVLAMGKTTGLVPVTEPWRSSARPAPVASRMTSV